MNLPKSNAAIVGACPECGAIRAGGFYVLPKDTRAMAHDWGCWAMEGLRITRYDAPLPTVTFSRHTDGCSRAEPEAKP